MKAEEEALLVEDARQEAEEHEHVQLKVEEGVRLALEVRRRAEEEDFGLKAKDAEIRGRGAGTSEGLTAV